MKKIQIAALGVAALLAGAAWSGTTQNAKPSLLGADAVVQVGIVVKDIERASRAYAELFGVDIPAWFLTDTVNKARTEFRGRPSEARAKLAFFQLKNITLELIEPVGGPSTWREFLDGHGEGIHHIAFEVKGMDEKLRRLGEGGIPLLQKGDYEGGRYAYVDGTGRLAVILELLENF